MTVVPVQDQIVALLVAMCDSVAHTGNCAKMEHLQLFHTNYVLSSKLSFPNTRLSYYALFFFVSVVLDWDALWTETSDVPSQRQWHHHHWSQVCIARLRLNPHEDVLWCRSWYDQDGYQSLKVHRWACSKLCIAKMHDKWSCLHPDLSVPDKWSMSVVALHPKHDSFQLSS